MKADTKTIPFTLLPNEQGILDGSASMLARVVQFRIEEHYKIIRQDDKDPNWWHFDRGDVGGATMKCPFGQPGSVLEVSESIPQSIWRPMQACPGYPDFTTLRAIQKDRGAQLAHTETCSSVWISAFLCDCGAIEDEWNRLSELVSIRLRVLSTDCKRVQDIDMDDVKYFGVKHGLLWSCENILAEFATRWNFLHENPEHKWEANPRAWIARVEKL